MLYLYLLDLRFIVRILMGGGKTIGRHSIMTHDLPVKKTQCHKITQNETMVDLLLMCSIVIFLACNFWESQGFVQKLRIIFFLHACQKTKIVIRGQELHNAA